MNRRRSIMSVSGFGGSGRQRCPIVQLAQRVGTCQLESPEDAAAISRREHGHPFREQPVDKSFSQMSASGCQITCVQGSLPWRTALAAQGRTGGVVRGYRQDPGAGQPVLPHSGQAAGEARLQGDSRERRAAGFMRSGGGGGESAGAFLPPKTRKRLSLEAHTAVFGFELERLRGSGLAKTSEIKMPPGEDLVKLDRNRPEEASNKDWMHPHGPEARITKMKTAGRAWRTCSGPAACAAFTFAGRRMPKTDAGSRGGLQISDFSCASCTVSAGRVRRPVTTAVSPVLRQVRPLAGVPGPSGTAHLPTPCRLLRLQRPSPGSTLAPLGPNPCANSAAWKTRLFHGLLASAYTCC